MSLDYATEREQFGRRIAEFQLLQGMLADSQTECYAAESMKGRGEAPRSGRRRQHASHPAVSYTR